MKLFKRLVVLCFYFGLFSFVDSYAVDSNGFQCWQTNAGSWKANEYWALTAEDEFRIGEQLVYNHVDVGIVFYGLADWLDLSFNYRYVDEKKSNGWNHENRPHLLSLYNDTKYLLFTLNFRKGPYISTGEKPWQCYKTAENG